MIDKRDIYPELSAAQRLVLTALSRLGGCSNSDLVVEFSFAVSEVQICQVLVQLEELGFIVRRELTVFRTSWVPMPGPLPPRQAIVTERWEPTHLGSEWAHDELRAA